MARSLISPPEIDNLRTAARLLSEGKLVGVPTETVYGLAANVFDATAVRKIFAAKGRPSTNPLIVHLADVSQIESVIASPLPSNTQSQLDRIIDLWPGPLTVVLPKHASIPDIVTAGRDTVALRVPSHPVMHRLLRECQFPLAAPSANVSKYVSATTAEHVAHGLGDHLEMIIDGGACEIGIESTIVALGDTPRLLRPGAITAETLAARWGLDPADLMPAKDASKEVVLEAPGMMLQHYSPRTRTITIDDFDIRSVSGRTGRIHFAPRESSSAFAIEETLSQRGCLDEVAAGLFSSLRRLDAASLDLIVVDTCPEEGVGRAIMDRIRRATARESS